LNDGERKTIEPHLQHPERLLEKAVDLSFDEPLNSRPRKLFFRSPSFHSFHRGWTWGSTLLPRAEEARLQEDS
jgi:hypothetical protein